MHVGFSFLKAIFDYMGCRFNIGFGVVDVSDVFFLLSSSLSDPSINVSAEADSEDSSVSVSPLLLTVSEKSSVTVCRD